MDRVARGTRDKGVKGKISEGKLDLEKGDQNQGPYYLIPRLPR